MMEEAISTAILAIAGAICVAIGMLVGKFLTPPASEEELRPCKHCGTAIGPLCPACTIRASEEGG